MKNFVWALFCAILVWAQSGTPLSRLSSSNTNSILYVGGDLAGWAGSDIGAQINSAYAALPASGEIYILPHQGRGCYNFSTPIVLTTANKAVKLTGLAPSNQEPQGACLNYTPTDATSAITVDYMSASGSAYAVGQGFEGITLTNNGCVKPGGCGSSATGIQIGVSQAGNYGMLLGEIKNTKVSGFGTGIMFASSIKQSWGVAFLDSTLSFNTIGLKTAERPELIKWIGGAIAVNGTGISGPFEIDITNASIDSNTVAGVANPNLTSGMTLTSNGVHWENLNESNTHYISGNVNGTVYGGMVLDDNNTGNADYLFSSTGLYLNFDGVPISSGGQTLTQIFLANTVGGQGFVRFLVGSRISTVGGTNANNIVDFSTTIDGGQGRSAKFGGTPITIPALHTLSNCSSSASPAVCGSAAAGNVAITNPATTVVVETTALTANSQILIVEDPTRPPGTARCNTTLGRTYMVTARSASLRRFTITASATPSSDSACLSYLIVN